MAKLAGRSAIVTGGARGVGASIARLLRKEGARVLITYLAAETDARKLSHQGIDIMRADVTSVRDTGKVVDTALERFGRLDILVNHAGAAISSAVEQDIEEVSPAEMDRFLRIHLMGTFLLCRAAAPELRKRPGAAIVNFSSAGDLSAGRFSLVGGAAGGGVVGFTRALARVLAPRVRANVVAPGPIRNEGREIDRDRCRELEEHVPLQRFGEPDEVARAVLFLVSNDSLYVTGQTLFVDGGLASWPFSG